MCSLLLQISDLKPETIAKATRELNEYPEHREQAITNLRLAIESQNLKGCTADAFLLRFLRAKKFNVINALRLYNNYYCLRIRYPEIFTNLVPSMSKHMFLDGVICRLPEPHPDGQALILFRPGMWDSCRYPVADIFRANILVIEDLMLRWPETQIHGVIILIDMINFNWRHAVQLMAVSFLKRVANFLQGTTPIRVKAVHIFNEPAVFSRIYSTLKPLLKQKNQERIKIHGKSLNDLHHAIPPRLIPRNLDLGGTGPDTDFKAYLDELVSMDSFFRYMNQFPIFVNKPL